MACFFTLPIDSILKTILYPLYRQALKVKHQFLAALKAFISIDTIDTYTSQ